MSTTLELNGGKMKHILLEKAFKYDIPRQNVKLFKGYNYDDVKGYWVNVENGKPLMHEDASFKPRTKKEDVETGEDRKGE